MCAVSSCAFGVVGASDLGATFAWTPALSVAVAAASSAISVSLADERSGSAAINSTTGIRYQAQRLSIN